MPYSVSLDKSFLLSLLKTYLSPSSGHCSLMWHCSATCSSQNFPELVCSWKFYERFMYKIQMFKKLKIITVQIDARSLSKCSVLFFNLCKFPSCLMMPGPVSDLLNSVPWFQGMMPPCTTVLSCLYTVLYSEYAFLDWNLVIEPLSDCTQRWLFLFFSHS